MTVRFEASCGSNCYRYRECTIVYTQVILACGVCVAVPQRRSFWTVDIGTNTNTHTHTHTHTRIHIHIHIHTHTYIHTLLQTSYCLANRLISSRLTVFSFQPEKLLLFIKYYFAYFRLINIYLYFIYENKALINTSLAFRGFAPRVWQRFPYHAYLFQFTKRKK